MKSSEFLFIILVLCSLYEVDSLPTSAEVCERECGTNAHCSDFEDKCYCNDGYLGRPATQCVSRDDNDLIKKMYLGYLNNKPPQDSCPQGSDKDIVALPECTVRDVLSSLHGCWKIYSDGFPYGSDKQLCTERIAEVVSCGAKAAMRCIGSYCHQDCFFFGLAVNDDNVTKTEEQYQKFINEYRKEIEPYTDLSYQQLLRKMIGPYYSERSANRLDNFIQQNLCPDLGVTPELFKQWRKFRYPVSEHLVEKYCKKGIITKLQDLGMEMTEKWFTSTSKKEINKAYRSFKRQSTKAFLESCSDITKVHDAFYNQYRNVPVGPYDHEKELGMALAWKFYLVMTDFLIKHWYPESNIYDESVWKSANSFEEKNVIKGEIENFLAKNGDEEKKSSA